MSKFEVAKPFNTANRRMTVGVAVSSSDDLTPHSFEERRSGGYVRAVVEPAAAAAPVVRAPRVKADEAK